MRAGFPPAVRGQAIGLLGGSFDPPHAGHLHIAHAAMVRFGLDRVWWLVSPGNPLKVNGPAPLDRRVAAVQMLVKGRPRHVVTGIEALLGTRHTAATLRRLRALYPGVRFVWLMGSDNLAGLHRWDRWQSILRAVPVGVLARPGTQCSARLARAARRFAHARLASCDSHALPACRPPVWCMLDIPLRPESSTALRARGAWPGAGGADGEPVARPLRTGRPAAPVDQALTR
jgi:nicotinate-nucleotide adenylyltransferase